MKTAWIAIVLLFVISISLLSMSRADIAENLVVKYCEALNGADGTSRNFVRDAMDKEIPASDKDEFYALIIDRAANELNGEGAICFILSDVESRGPKFVWNQHLKRSILAQAKSGSISVRGLLVGLLGMHDRDECRDLCLSYLDDSDDRVRYRALSAVARWPDARQILTRYIQDHSASTDHTESLELARGCVGGPPSAQ